MRVFSVASECAPLVKTGGLADVAGALPKALQPHGVEVRTLLPAYRGLADELEKPKTLSIRLSSGREASLLSGRVSSVDVLLLDAPGYFDRPGNPYLGPDGSDWADNHLRFGYLCEVAASVAQSGLAGGWVPDVVHAHDWQAGLVPAYLSAQGASGPPVVFTIHNIAYQGIFGPEVLTELGLPERMMHVDMLEYWGQVSFLKAGIAMAQRVTTVSPGYARELLDPAFGMGLEGLLSHRGADLVGILNGIDLDEWDPAQDTALAAGYNARAGAKKAANRKALAQRFRLAPRDDAPLFIVVSRLTGQKGLDLLIDAIPALLDNGACLALLGSGDAALEARFTDLAGSNPGRIGAVIGYDEKLSHLMQGGGDAILIPSRFEPCGLTQLYGLRYGTLPVVARTGGLGDTVIDANEAALEAGVATGFVHDPGSADALALAIKRACDVFRNSDAWSRMRANAMKQEVGWDTSAGAYANLYAEVAAA